METILVRHRFADKGLYSKSYGFSSNHVRMWELDHKEGWETKNWCFWIVVLEKTLESPFNCKEIQPIHSEGDQPWNFFGRNDAKAETPILWPPDAKGWLIEKDPDVVQDWGQEEKGVTEDQVVGWHHWLNGHEFEETIIPEIVNDREEAWYAVVLWVTKSWIWQLTEQQQLKDYVCNICLQWYAEHC